MKAEELRIGNLVFEDKVSMKIEVIFSDRYSAVKLMTSQGTEIQAHIDLIKPIPLTEEWLLKFGFTVGNLKNCYFKDWGTNGIETVVHEYHYKGGFEYELGSNRYKVIEYVHQLQNLYFALTGEELITPIA